MFIPRVYTVFFKNLPISIKTIPKFCMSSLGIVIKKLPFICPRNLIWMTINLLSEYLEVRQIRFPWFLIQFSPKNSLHFHQNKLRFFLTKIEQKIFFRISVLTPELRILEISKRDSNIIWVARRRTFPLHYVAIKNDVFIFSEIATLDLENTG